MGQAPRIEVSAPMPARAAFLATAYADLTQDPARLSALIDQLRNYHAREVIAAWQTLARLGDWQALAADLMAVHYDPRYLKSQARSVQAPQQVALGALDAQTLADAAQDLMARFS
jgi:tRNA 2-selenouridine synthase